MKNLPKISIVIVNYYNTELILNNIEYLKRQTFSNFELIIVDNSSTMNLDHLDTSFKLEIYNLFKNCGFSTANNIGYLLSEKSSKYILFLNPDAFLPNNWLLKAVNVLEKRDYINVGIYSTPLFGYDFKDKSATKKIDSLGIYQTWYGKWFDKGQSKGINSLKVSMPYEPQAVCGALMFCRKTAIDDILIKGYQVFDQNYFMYKEDIELSLRVKRKWRLLIDPSHYAYHCRGWNKKRKLIPKNLKVLSSQNELKMHLKYKPVFAMFSLIKLIFVKYFG